MVNQPDQTGSGTEPSVPPHEHTEIRSFQAELAEIKARLESYADAVRDAAAQLTSLDERISVAPTNTTLAAQKEELNRQINELQTRIERAHESVPQHGHAEMESLSTQVQALSTTTSAAGERLATVEQKIEAQKKKLISRIDRAGIVLGVFVSLLALGVGILGLPKLIKEFRSRPNTKLVSGWPLELTYDPAAKKLGFIFHAIIRNDGGKDDRIKEVRASVRPDAVPVEQAISLRTGIKFREQGGDVSPPFNVGTTAPRELVCSIITDASADDLETFIRPGVNHLHVELYGDDDKSRGQADYCFWVLNANVRDIHAATSVQTFTYVTPYQNCQGNK